MTTTNPTGITPAKLRSGAPDALAALCNSRGAAVFAYCQRAVGRNDAAEAAAEAFAQLRIAILSPGTLTSGEQAERLLRGVTRQTAMLYLIDLDGPGSAPCAERAGELLGYLENTLTPADRRMLAAHVGRCHSCAEALRRLEGAEAAFNVKPGARLRRAVAAEIVTALAQAAPVGSHEGDPIAVRDEALRLLGSDDGPPAADPTSTAAQPPDPAPTATEPPEPAPAPPQPPEPPPTATEPPEPAPAPAQPPEPAPTAAAPFERGDDSQLAGEARAVGEPAEQLPAAPSPVAPATPDRPKPVRQEPRAAAEKRGMLDRLRARSHPERFGPSRTAWLLRSAGRFAMVVVAAGAAGTLLGIGIAALTGEDETPSSAPGVATSGTLPVAVERLGVDVTSTTVRPARIDDVEGARVTVTARVENRSGRPVSPEPPRLLIDNIPVAAEPASAGSSPALLARSLAAGAVAQGTLRFDLQSRTATELAASRVRLRLAGRIVALTPVLDEPPASG